MQARYLLVLVVVALAVAVPNAAYAGFVNLGFESGTSGWASFYEPGGASHKVRDGSAGNEYWVSNLLYTYLPPEGIAYMWLDPDGTGDATAMSQTQTLGGGEVIEALAAFDAQDVYSAGPPVVGDDWAEVRIYSGTWNAEQISKGLGGAPGALVATPWHADVFTGPDDGPWTKWSWTVPTGGGTYTLAYLVANQGDALNDSPAMFDAVPEASTAVLFGVSLVGLSLLGYRRRKAVAR